jgi:hypothetical protein
VSSVVKKKKTIVSTDQDSKDRVQACSDKEDYTRPLVYPEPRLDYMKPGQELEKQQYKIDNA